MKFVTVCRVEELWQVDDTSVFIPQARELGLAKLEFETHRTVFAETMREFAPGFGAGAFLAKAMARNAAQVSSARPALSDTNSRKI